MLQDGDQKRAKTRPKPLLLQYHILVLIAISTWEIALQDGEYLAHYGAPASAADSRFTQFPSQKAFCKVHSTGLQIPIVEGQFRGKSGLVRLLFGRSFHCKENPQ